MPDTRRFIADYLPIEPISAEASRKKSVRLTTNERYRVVRLGDSYWLYVVWDPLGTPDPKPLMIRNPVKHLDYAKREVVTSRYYDNRRKRLSGRCLTAMVGEGSDHADHSRSESCS